MNMNIIKFMNWTSEHRKYILAISHLVMLTNTFIAILAVNLGVFELFGLFFWSWILGMVSFVIVQKVFGGK